MSKRVAARSDSWRCSSCGLGDGMKITGSSTVEYIEVDDHEYERTGCGTWTSRMGESMEPVYDPAELEQEYQGIVSGKLPAEFVCFPQHGRNPRKLRKVEHDSYDMLLWLDGKWRFTDNVSEDAACEWFRHGESDVYVR